MSTSDDEVNGWDVVVPVEFDGSDSAAGKEQPEYNVLPFADLNNREGAILVCYRLTLRQRLVTLFTGRLWLYRLTFRRSLEPHLMVAHGPTVKATLASLTDNTK